MDWNKRAEEAVALKKSSGCNCAQAVAVALADETALSAEQIGQIAAGFGLGMGTMGGTCGALVGAGIIAGLKTEGKGSGKLTKQMSESFRERCGALICEDLKGVKTGKVLCPCDECVRNAVLAYGEVSG